MSSQAQHEARVTHNKQLFNDLNSSKYPDWAVVVLFYQGVHLIEGILDTQGEHSDSHQMRSSYMEDHIELFPIDVKRNYRQLERLSKQARYKPELPITNDNLNVAFTCLETIKNWYKNTKNIHTI